MVSPSSLGAGFTLVPDCILTHPDLGPNEMFLAAEALRLAAEFGGNEAQLSYRYLMGRMRCGQARIRAAREQLCAALPGVFTSVTGDPTTMTPDRIVIDRDRLLLAHADWIAARELQRATRRNRTPRQVSVTLSNGDTVLVTAPVSSQTQGVSSQAQPVLSQTQPCVQADTALSPAEHHKKTYKTLKTTSSSRIASLTEGAENENISVSQPGVPDGSQPHKEEVVAKKSSAARPARARSMSDTDVARFVAIWNEGRHERFASKQVASPSERRSLDQLLAAHSGDVAEALETWTLAVQEVARLGDDPKALFWGDRNRRRAPTIANLLPNWGKHADAARNHAEQAARRPTASAIDHTKNLSF